MLRVDAPNGEDYITLRSEFSKKQVNRVLMSAPRDGTDIGASLAFIEVFFEVAVVGWSMTDEVGNPIPPSLAAYQDLSAEPGAWVDKVLVEHLQRTIGRNVEDLEGKPSN